MQGAPNITVPSGVGGLNPPPLVTITAGDYTGPEDSGLPSGFFTFAGAQGFNGYVQQGGTFYKLGNGIRGLGIKILGNTATLQSASSFTGRVVLVRDNDSSSGASIVSNTGGLATAPAGTWSITTLTKSSITIQFNSFPVSRQTGGGMTGVETLGINGTVTFNNVPGGS